MAKKPKPVVEPDRDVKREARGPRPLSLRRRLFVEVFLSCKGNASTAARAAGYADPSEGSRLLKSPEIRKAIDERLAEAKKCLSADQVLEEFSDQARASIDDFLTGDQLDLEKARALGKMHLIKKFRWTKYGWSIELHDAQAALVHLGRYYGLFTDRHEISGPNGGPIPTAVIVRMPAKLTLAEMLGIDPDQLPDGSEDARLRRLDRTPSGGLNVNQAPRHDGKKGGHG